MFQPAGHCARPPDGSGAASTHQPIKGIAQDADGVLHDVTIDPASLAYLSTTDSLYYPVTRETDPAVRAIQENGDSPATAAADRENNSDSLFGSPGSNPEYGSNGLYLAVNCQDYPQIYDMTSPPEARIANAPLRLRFSARRTPIFIIRHAGGIQRDATGLQPAGSMLTWPVPSPAYPPGQPVPPDATFTAAPVLVFNGDMDTLTPVLEGVEVSKEYGHAQQVITHNTFHVSASAMKTTARKNWCGVSSPTSTRRYSCAAHIAECGWCPSSQPQRRNSIRQRRCQESGHAADLQVAAAAAMRSVMYWILLGERQRHRRGPPGGHGVPIGTNPATFGRHPASSPVDQRRGCERRFTWNYYKPGAVNGQLSVTGQAVRRQGDGHLQQSRARCPSDDHGVDGGRPSWRPCMRRKRVIHAVSHDLGQIRGRLRRLL